MFAVVVISLKIRCVLTEWIMFVLGMEQRSEHHMPWSWHFCLEVAGQSLMWTFTSITYNVVYFGCEHIEFIPIVV